MAGWAAALSVLKHFVPVSSLAKLMWKDAREKKCEPTREALIVSLAGWLSNGTNVTNRGACLQRSLLAYRYLSALGADPHLVVAFAKCNGTVVGHAWVEVDGRAVGEPADPTLVFKPTAVFGVRAQRLAL
jgi:hypothetical protein